MKNILFYICITLLTINVNGQKNNQLYEIKYTLKFYPQSKKMIDDSCVLLISKEGSYFKSLKEPIYQKSIQAQVKQILEGGRNIDASKQDQNLIYFMPFSIKKDYTTKKIWRIEKIGDEDFGFIIDSMNSLKWNYTNDSIRIASIVAYKAICKVDTSTIEAWFSNKFPINEGPLQFTGLPGLIVKLKKSNGLEISLKSITATTKPKNINFPKYTSTTQKKFDVAKKNYRTSLMNGSMEEVKVKKLN